MTTKPNQLYPDISDILARKAEGRRELAACSFVEKIAIAEALREQLEPLTRFRESRKSQAGGRSSSGNTHND